MEGPEGQGNDFCLCEEKKKKKGSSSTEECPAQAGKDPSSATPSSRAGSQEKLHNAPPSVNPPLKKWVASIPSKRKSLHFVKTRVEKFSFNSKIAPRHSFSNEPTAADRLS